MNLEDTVQFLKRLGHLRALQVNNAIECCDACERCWREVQGTHIPFVKGSFHLRRDSRWSIAYSEELISSTISVTLQRTDRHHGIVGQERCHNQRDS